LYLDTRVEGWNEIIDLMNEVAGAGRPGDGVRKGKALSVTHA
jgi:hypothetical protein